MEKELLSIIVPVYNTPTKYVKACLNSICSLTDIDFMIYLIDDGSQEKNSLVYKNLVSRYYATRVEYCYQRNAGVSSARNYGLSIAKGKYVMFVDSDDIIISSAIKKDDFSIPADIIVYDTCFIKNGISYSNKEFNSLKGFIDNQELYECLIRKKSMHGPCAKLYQLEFLRKNRTQFATDFIHGEDAMFNLDLLDAGADIFYIDRELYIYNYSASTLDERWIQKPDITFENMVALYKRKQEGLSDFFCESKKKDDLLLFLFDQLVKDFFSARVVLNSDRYKQYSLIKAKIRVFLKNNIDLASRLTFYSKLKLYLIIIDNDLIFWAITKIRTCVVH
ncbi:glycosyltransferase family A protein [Blautia sp. JLR.GB0024]|uniref:glycosyltransferase family 2 protein n=1 Tax=unclassified Blautia TaxID=2648079 RepID=UPI0030053095